MASSKPLGYRPALDGVRALGVLAVVVSHTTLHPTGGELGVDIFFVLSGFLITTLLLEERSATGRVGLRDFYARRALRLLPALGVVLVLASGLRFLLGSNDGTNNLSLLIVVPAILLYFANWLPGLRGPSLGNLNHVSHFPSRSNFIWSGRLPFMACRF